MFHLSRAADSNSILSNIETIKTKLAKQGYRLQKRVGVGTYGVAFSTNKGKIIKITSDPDELQTSVQLVGKNLKHVVKIFKVFRLTSLPELGFILQEKLEPLDKQVEKIVDALNLQGTDTIISCQGIAKRYNLKHFEDIRDYMAHKFEDPELAELKFQQILPNLKNVEEKWDILKPEVRAFIADSVFHARLGNTTLQVINDNLPLVSKLLESLNELYNYHIHFLDTHGGNLMKNSSGILKWVDLGYGSSALGKSRVEKIQGIVLNKQNIKDQRRILKYLKKL